MLHGDVGQELARRVVDAVRARLDTEITPADALIRPSTRDGVDYQCNAAMGLAKKLGRKPRDVAEAIVAGLDTAAPDGTALVSGTEIAGPGFVNLVLADEWLTGQATGLRDDERLGVPETTDPRRFALDYSSPNVAKEMHVGHLRSSIIGDAISRLLTFAGHEVTPHNHLGDWGTPFGMLIEHLIDNGWTPDDDPADHTIADLGEFYTAARRSFDSDPQFAERARRRVVLLQGGDATTLALWQQLVDESTRHFEQVYDLLGIRLTSQDSYGESFYNPYLAEVIDELEAKGLTEVSDGAVCVFPPGFTGREGDRLPLIVRKSDGGYGYAATDLATVRYWVTERKMTDLLYVVGTPQAQHFQMVFAASRQAGWLTDEHATVHIGFGSILGEDGKLIRSRAGGTLKLVELLNEAVQHAAEVIAERSELDEAAQAEIAKAVGIGAVKYADLSNDRERDYQFTWQKMLAKDGNTSVYLQYANARIRSILRKAGDAPAPGTVIELGEPAERALLLQLTRLPAALDAATEAYAPHKLCQYLYETATAFSSFYETCPILASSTSDELRASRLVLAELTSRVLVLGLSLLGINAPERL